MKYVIVKTTTDREEFAKALAGEIVANKLGACVQISKINSTYVWEGEVCNENEFLLEVKTTSERSKALQEFILQKHHYENPEVIEVAISGGSQRYLGWVEEGV